MAARKKGAKKARATTKTRTTTKRRTATKRTATKSKAKKATKAKPAKAAKPVSAGPLGKVSSVYTKSALVNTLSDRTGLKSKDIKLVLAELAVVVEGHLKRGGPGKFTLPGMLKMTVKNVAAKKARKGINPFTGEMTTFKAKPASRKVRVIALKALKEMAV